MWLFSHSRSLLFLCVRPWKQVHSLLDQGPGVLLHEQVRERKQNTFCKCGLVVLLNFCLMPMLDHVSPLLTWYSVCVWIIRAQKGSVKLFLLNLVSHGTHYVNWNLNKLNIYKFIQVNVVTCISSFEWSETRWFINYCFLALLWYVPLGRSKK